MPDIDEISRILGKIEGAVDELKTSNNRQWEKLENIESILANHRISMASIAGSISIIISLIIAWLSKLFRE